MSRTHAQGPTNTVLQNFIFNCIGHGACRHRISTCSSVSYLQLLLTCADLRVSFFLDVRICVLVHGKIKPSRTELSITLALKSAKTSTNLRVSSISIFRGPNRVQMQRPGTA